MNRILVTGGAGYVGSVLVPKLLKAGYFVRVLDLFLYEKDPFKDIEYKDRLDVIRGDIRNKFVVTEAMKEMECVIHLACISNDPSFDLNPELGKSINLDAFEPLVEIAKRSGVKRFINASSSSVYGISEDPEVTEESECNPLTDYSKYKLETEKILKKFESTNFTTVSIRSATVCGYSPRQRLDVIVNILTNHAFNKKVITVHGGPQKRPNIHIEDITDLYMALIKERSSIIGGQVFNYGGPNHTVEKLAEIVQAVAKENGILADIQVEDTNDPRSYHISSDKAYSLLGYLSQRTIEDAVNDLIDAFYDGKLPESLENPKYFNIKQMKGYSTETKNLYAGMI